MPEFPRTEQEEKCDRLFQDLERTFRKLDKANKPDRISALLKEVTAKLKEVKALVKDFEREARADGMPTSELTDRRRAMADDLNRFIDRKKAFTTAEGAKGELFEGAGIATNEAEVGVEGQTVQQLITRGRAEINDIDKTLGRAERLVEETRDVGKNTAAVLHDQTKQLNKIMDDIADIEFNLKKATAVIRDITRGLLTDKCIGFLLLLVVAGVVAIIVVKVVNPNKKAITTAVTNTTAFQQGLALVNTGTGLATNLANNTLNTLANQSTQVLPGRRMLMQRIRHLLKDDAW